MAESKPEPPAKEAQPVTLPPEAEAERPLGALLVEARERKGLSREDVARETHLPAHYLRMIETDNFGGIADQLYVLPFLRRYAAFLEMDAEEVASRFVRDVQRAEVSIQRINDPIKMVARRTRGPLLPILYGILVTLIVVVAAEIAIRRYRLPQMLFGDSSSAGNPPPASIVTSIAPASEPSSQPLVTAPSQPDSAPQPDKSK